MTKLKSVFQHVFKNSFTKRWMIDPTDDHYEIDIRNAERLLNWKPRCRLPEALPLRIVVLHADLEKWMQKSNLAI